MSATTKLQLPLHGATSPESAHPVGVNHDQSMTILDDATVLVATPANATATGKVGQVAFDSTHFYVCIAANTWVRATLATW